MRPELVMHYSETGRKELGPSFWPNQSPFRCEPNMALDVHIRRFHTGKTKARLIQTSVVLTKQNLARLTSFLLLSLEADIHAKNTAIAKLLNPVATQLLAFICAPWRLHDALCSHNDYRSTQR
jgi:hypothetical protein